MMSSSSSELLEIVRNGNLHELQKRCNEGESIHKLDEDERNLLHWAAASGSDEIVEYLLKFPQVEINHQDDAGWTPLMSAVSAGHTNIVRMLLENGADANLSNANGQLPLHYHKGRPEVVELLLPKTRNINKKDNTRSSPLIRAIAGKPSAAVLEMFLRRGVNVNFQDINGDTPCHIAISEKQDDLAIMLIEHGADPTMRNGDGQTCFDLASRSLRAQLEESQTVYAAQRKP